MVIWAKAFWKDKERKVAELLIVIDEEDIEEEVATAYYIIPIYFREMVVVDAELEGRYLFAIYSDDDYDLPLEEIMKMKGFVKIEDPNLISDFKRIKREYHEMVEGKKERGRITFLPSFTYLILKKLGARKQ